MKKRDLERQIREAGWRFLRQGSNHEIWTNGEMTEAVPRHREIHERLASKILKTARENPPKGGSHV